MILYRIGIRCPLGLVEWIMGEWDDAQYAADHAGRLMAQRRDFIIEFKSE